MSTVFHDLGVTVQTGNNVIPNPGTGNTINFNGMSHGVCTLSAGTYKLPNSNPGTEVSIIATGAVVLTNADATAVVSMTTGQNRKFFARTAAIWAPVDSFVTELYTHLTSIQGFSVGAPLNTFREVDSSGDVGTTDTAGGTLASNTTPILRGEATTEALAIHWEAGNSDIIASNVALPPDLDALADMYVDLVVQTNNVADLPEFTILSNFNGGSIVTDTTAAATSTISIQTITATIGASDVVVASTLGFQIVPSAHATHVWTLFGVRVRGKRDLLSA